MRGANIRPKRLHRKRIEEMLSMMWETPVFFVTAPMGYGKSIAVRDYLKPFQEGEEAGVYWFTFHEGQKDTEWFWKNYLETLQEQMGVGDLEGFRDTSLPRTPEERHFYFMFLKEFIIHRPCVCVFDDYQECNSAFLNSIIEEAAREAIPNFHMVIIERSYPDIGYEEMCLKNQCILMEQEDLRMNQEEIQNFFAENGESLASDEAQHCYKFTEGWTAAVYLILLDYKKTHRISSTATVASLLREGILQQLSERERAVLCKVAIFHRVTPEQAVYLTEDPDAAAILMNLVANIDFIRYESDRRQFYAHAMLQSVGEEEILRLGYSRDSLVRKNAEWFVAHKLFVPAILTYRDLHATDEIYQIIREHAQPTFFLQAPDLFEKIYREMPPELKAHSKMGYVQFLFVKVVYDDFDAGVEEYKRFKEILLKYATCRMNRDFYRFLMMLESTEHFYDMSAMRSLLQGAAKYLGKEEAVDYARELRRMYAIPDLMWIQHQKPGCYAQEVVETKAFGEDPIGDGSVVENGMGFLLESEYLYQIGQLKEAEELAMKAMIRANMSKEYSVEIAATYIFMKASILMGNRERVEQKIQDVRDVVKQQERKTIARDAKLMDGDIAGMLGNLNDSQRWVIDTDLNESNNIVRKIGFVQQICARMLINAEQYLVLEVLAGDIRRDGEQMKFVFKEILSHLYYAVSYWYTDRQPMAVGQLQEALNLTRQDQFVAIYAEYGAKLLPILEAMDRGSYEQQVYQFCQECLQRKNPERMEEKSLLTPREEEIMQCVIAGMKNRQIGEELHLALVTVEKNLSSIYRKLKVKNRAGAIREYQRKWN